MRCVYYKKVTFCLILNFIIFLKSKLNQTRLDSPLSNDRFKSCKDLHSSLLQKKQLFSLNNSCIGLSINLPLFDIWPISNGSHIERNETLTRFQRSLRHSVFSRPLKAPRFALRELFIPARVMQPKQNCDSLWKQNTPDGVLSLIDLIGLRVSNEFSSIDTVQF